MRSGICLLPLSSILLFLAILGHITLTAKGKSTINYLVLLEEGLHVSFVQS